VVSIGLLMGASPASAQICVQQIRECWHVREYYVFRPEFGVTVSPRQLGALPRHEHVALARPCRRGYWHEGIWINF